MDSEMVDAKTPASIMVVDDDPLIRALLNRCLAHWGYHCIAAEGVASAKKLLARHAFEGCLVDLQMPGESGLALLTYICQEYPDVAPIMLTGVHSTDIAVTAMKLGAYDYVTKPFEHRDLLTRLEHALETRRLKSENRRYREQLEALVGERTQQLEQLLVSTVESLVLTLQMRSEYTEGHSQRVAYWSVRTAQVMGLDDVEQRILHHAALLHDMGKIAVKDNILEKPGPLDQSERQDIERHPVLAHDVLMPLTKAIENFQPVIETILHHHEYYRGDGYPSRLEGTEIPKLARLISVVDAYDSMVSKRPYREPVSMEEALKELKRCAGTQFDPQIVEAFAACLTEEKAYPMEVPNINAILQDGEVYVRDHSPQRNG